MIILSLFTNLILDGQSKRQVREGTEDEIGEKDEEVSAASSVVLKVTKTLSKTVFVTIKGHHLKLTHILS